MVVRRRAAGEGPAPSGPARGVARWGSRPDTAVGFGCDQPKPFIGCQARHRVFLLGVGYRGGLPVPRSAPTGRFRSPQSGASVDPYIAPTGASIVFYWVARERPAPRRSRLRRAVGAGSRGEGRRGGRGARERPTPRPPPSLHQSTWLSVSERALKRLQRRLTTFKGRGVRFGSTRPGRDYIPPPYVPGGPSRPSGRALYRDPGPLV